MFSTSDEIEEQKAAHLIHECWSGRAQRNWIKTLKTLRGHWLSGQWDREKAGSLVRYNLRDAYRTLRGHAQDSEISWTPVFDRAQQAMLDTVERMFQIERANK